MERRCLDLMLAALVAVSSACGAGPVDSAVEETMPTITAEVGTVVRRTLTEDLVVRGTIAALPNQDVTVSALVAGRVNALTVAEGDSVREGQIVARIDTRAFDDQRQQATASVQQATVQLENARLNLQRNEQLFTRGIAAGKDVEDAKTAVAEAQASQAQANAALSVVALHIERADVRAPIAGRVVKRMASVGEQVDGTAAEPLLKIANLDRVELAASVPSGQLSRIAVGQTVSVTTTGRTDHLLTGIIVAISPAVDVATNTGLVRIRLNNDGGLLRVGMFAEGRVRTGERANVLTVPPSAIVRTDAGAAVYVVTGDIARRTPVTVGVEQPEAVEILSGVTEHQSVLTSAVYGLGSEAKLAKSS